MKFPITLSSATMRVPERTSMSCPSFVIKPSGGALWANAGNALNTAARMVLLRSRRRFMCRPPSEFRTGAYFSPGVVQSKTSFVLFPDTDNREASVPRAAGEDTALCHTNDIMPAAAAAPRRGRLALLAPFVGRRGVLKARADILIGRTPCGEPPDHRGA